MAVVTWVEGKGPTKTQARAEIAALANKTDKTNVALKALLETCLEIREANETRPDDCSHCGAPGDDIEACRMKCTIAGAQQYPCHGEAP